jgi:hypothetical protein
MSLNIQERNSEGKITWVAIGLGILEIVLVVLDKVLGWGVVPEEHVAHAIMAGILQVATSAGVYTWSRPGKTASVTQRAVVEALHAKKPETDSSVSTPTS